MPLWWLVPVTLSAACILLVLLLSASTGSPVSNFYRDANAIAGQPAYYGSLEYVTNITMLMTGAIVLFTALSETQIAAKTAGFGVLFGLLTLVLGADDLFMIHESASSIHPILTEQLIYTLYAVTLLFIAILFHQQLTRSAFIFLLAALGFLFLSGIEDQFGRIFSVGLEPYWELFGFIVWGTFAIITAIDIKRGALED